MDVIVEQIINELPSDEDIRQRCSDSISKWIKNIRDCYNANQDEFANRVGMSRSSIAQWEAGLRIPTVAQYMRLSDWFGVTVNFLLGIDDDTIDYNSNEYDRREQLNKCLSLNLDMFNEKGRYMIEGIYYMMLNNPEFLKNTDDFNDDDTFFDMFEE